MRVFAAFLIAPALALADQGVAYAFAGWACAHQQEMVPHAVHAVFLVATLATVFFAWTESRAALREVRPAQVAGFSVQRHDALAICGLALAILSATVIVALWIPQWVLSPCFG